MGNDNKSAQLGMPFGTACNRLRKLILFTVLKKHGENVCARCGQEIAFVDDLSLEHVKSWQGVSNDLFWDVDNIKFSHLHCNSSVHRVTSASLSVLQESVLAKCRDTGAPEGMSWCFGHKQFLLTDKFSKNESRLSGVQKYCRECRKSLNRTGS